MSAVKASLWRDRWIGALPILLVVAAVAGCERREAAQVPERPRVAERAALDSREGRFFLKNTTNPFTGVLRETYTNGVVSTEAQVREGLLDGLTRGFYPSGVLQVEETFVAGVSHGTRRRFYDDGNPKAIEEIRDGRLHGRYERFHPGGSVAERGGFLGGKPDGLAESWDAQGKPVARVLFQEGKAVEQEFFQVPERRPVVSANAGATP